MSARSFLLATVLALATASSHAQSIDPGEQREVVHAVADLIEARYVDAAKGREVAAVLRRSDARWQEPRDRQAFAKEVTEFLRATSGDGHLGLPGDVVRKG